MHIKKTEKEYEEDVRVHKASLRWTSRPHVSPESISSLHHSSGYREPVAGRIFGATGAL